MAESVLIRFIGERGRAHHFLKLGPVEVWNPPEREFRGGDEISVQIQPNALNPDCVDLIIEDGQCAIEVPKDFFVIVEE